MSLGALFYPIGTKEKPIKFDQLFIPYIYREIYFEGVYIDVLNGRKDMVIVDIGANVGVTVQHFQNYAKKVYAVEPLSTHFEALAKNKEFNHWDNVELFQMAIAGKDGEVEMHPCEGNMTSTSYAMQYAGETETVKAMAMDTFFRENNIEEVDFMKFDVEGAEDDILRSDGFKAVAEKIKAIEVEFHLPTWTDLVEYMIGLGFKARKFDSSAIIVLFFR